MRCNSNPVHSFPTSCIVKDVSTDYGDIEGVVIVLD